MMTHLSLYTEIPEALCSSTSAFVWAALVMSVVACGTEDNGGTTGPTPDTGVSSVVVSPVFDTLVSLDETQQFTATARNASSGIINGKQFSWTSDDPTVFTVSSSGLVTAKRNGTVSLRATTDGITGNAEVTVSQTVASIVLASPKDTLTALGETVQLSATPRDANENIVPNASVSWASSADSVAVVDTSGEVTAVGTGDVGISVRSGATSDTVSLAVVQVPHSLLIDPDFDTLTALGSVLALDAVVADKNHNTVLVSFSWSTSDSNVATVDQTGLVTAAGNGDATITASVGPVTASITVTVRQQTTSIEVVAPKDTITALGEVVQLLAFARDANGGLVDDAAVTWSSSDVQVATVEPATGELTSMSVGSVTLRAATEALTDSVGLTIVQLAHTVTVSPDADTLNSLGDELALAAAASDKNSNHIPDATVVWNTSNPAIADVDSTGLVSAVGVGVVTISASVEGEASGSASISVRQVAASIDPFDPDPVVFEALEDQMQLSPVARDSNNYVITEPELGWASSDPSIVTVSSVGMAVSRANGTAAITASASGIVRSVAMIVDQTAVRVGVSPEVREITGIGTVQQFAAEAWDANDYMISDASPVWSSADNTVTTIDSSGRATGQGSGVATISGQVDGVVGDATLMVTVFTGISAGSEHSCAVTGSGDGFCWGSEGYGQLGNDSYLWTQNIRTSPAGEHEFGAISAGGLHTCGVTLNDDTYCWGNNQSAQLGSGPDSSYIRWSVPVIVHGGLNFESVDAAEGLGLGGHSCGLVTGGVAYCWGQGVATGDGVRTNRYSPIAVSGGYTYSMVSSGGQHSCGVTLAGGVYCWGNNYHGELGDGSTETSLFPVQVQSNETFAYVSAGTSHTCALSTTGSAFCWGSNDHGQLGDGTTGGADCPGFGSCKNVPVPVGGGMTFVQVDAGRRHTCAVSAAQEAYCWGDGSDGRLGDGTTLQRTSPSLVTGNLPFELVSCGWAHTCGITTNGVAYCWGDGTSGQLGDGFPTGYYRSATPMRVVER